MQRRLAPLLGLITLALTAVVVTINDGGVTSIVALQLLLLATASVSFVAAGFDDLPTSLAWYQLFGLGIVLLGGALVITYVLALMTDFSLQQLVASGAGVLGGLVIVFVGSDVWRGGHYIGVDTDAVGFQLSRRGD